MHEAVTEFTNKCFEQMDMLGLAFVNDDLAHFAVVKHMADVVVGGQQGLTALVEFCIDLNRLRIGELVRQDAQIGVKAQAT